MFLEAIYHRPRKNWSYAYNGTTIHLRIRTKKTTLPKCTPSQATSTCGIRRWNIFR